MKPENNDERKKIRLKFAAFYILSLVLIVSILSSFWGPLPSATIKGRKMMLTGNLSQEHQVLIADEMMHERLSQLQELDLKYAELLKDSATGTGLKTIIQTITESEEAFNKAIDSINRTSKNYSPEYMRKFEKLIASFKTLLDNRSYSSTGRHTPVSTIKIPAHEQHELSKLKKDLETKQNELEMLQKNLKTGKSDKFAYPISPDEKLRQENDFLKLALRSQVEQTTSLKKSNGELTTRVYELQKSNGSK